MNSIPNSGKTCKSSVSPSQSRAISVKINGMLHFKSIQIQNLLSFGPDSPELELKPINIVIGPNGSGKSNLFAALSLFPSETERYSIIEQGGGFRNWFWKSNIDVKSIVKVIFESSVKRISRPFEVSLTHEQGRFSSSGLQVGLISPEDVKDTNTELNVMNPLETIAKGMLNGYKDDKEEFQSSFFFFRNWQYGPSAPLRNGPQPIDFSNNWLRDDARNLAHVLKRLKESEQSYTVFKNFLSELYEDINVIQFTEAEDFLFFSVIENGGRKVPAARISDGTLRYLALLAVLCDPEPPKLICLEEPEMGLHPDLIQIVAKAVHYASERTQIIATTHSVSLVDKFTNSPENIVVCEKINGSTELRRLDSEEMKPWLEKYRLGNLWTSGQIGGNRW